jgi:aryl-alcohol dehydrogenase-like predicted oxidoreductase
MEQKKLGPSDLNVPSICLGGNVYGWTLPETGAFHQLDHALDLGLNFIDTADVYSRWLPGHQGGESEAIIGRWFTKTGRRKEVILATKVGMEMGEGQKGLHPRYIAEAADASLRRLQTDYIDLHQAHRDDPEIPLEETLGAFDRLIQAGKVRCIGASNYTGARLAEAVEISRKNGLAAYVSLQPHYNLVERQPFESDHLPAIEKYGLGVITYFSLASGFLTGKYTRSSDPSQSARGGTVKKYLNDRGFAVVDALTEIAKAHRASPASVALAWLLDQPGITAPIASATSDHQFEALFAATTLELDQDEIRSLCDISKEPVASSR